MFLYSTQELDLYTCELVIIYTETLGNTLIFLLYGDIKVIIQHDHLFGLHQRPFHTETLVNWLEYKNRFENKSFIQA